MAHQLADDRVRRLRLANQRLLPDSAASTVVATVKAVVGIQAQDQPAAALAVRARGNGLTNQDVDAARNQDRSIVRTWAMRGTLHWLAAEDVRWLIDLFGQEFIRKNRRRREELGLGDETCARAVAQLREILASRGPLTRDEITTELGARSIRLEGQARPHLLYVAALQGVICGGPDRGAQQTYVLTEDWIPKSAALHRDEAVALLARRYLAGYGPAAAADFANWSGLSMPDAWKAWRLISGEINELETSRGPLSLLKTQESALPDPRPARASVRLLGAFDTYPLGYRDRELVVAARYAKSVNAGGGIVRPTLVIDGQVKGTWKAKRTRNQIEVFVEPFEPPDPTLVAPIGAEATDIGRFFGLQARLSGIGD